MRVMRYVIGSTREIFGRDGCVICFGLLLFAEVGDASGNA
jgi:hypothetical protein